MPTKCSEWAHGTFFEQLAWSFGKNSCQQDTVAAICLAITNRLLFSLRIEDYTMTWQNNGNEMMYEVNPNPHWSKTGSAGTGLGLSDSALRDIPQLDLGRKWGAVFFTTGSCKEKNVLRKEAIARKYGTYNSVLCSSGQERVIEWRKVKIGDEPCNKSGETSHKVT